MNAAELRALWQLSMRDFPLYAWGSGDFTGFAFTNDEHDPDSPVKPLPDRPHLRTLNDLYEQSQLLVLLKSRQLMVSWFFDSRILHECLSPGRRWLVCCRLEAAADHQLERMWTQYTHLPEHLRPPATRTECNIVIHHPEKDSRIQAAAQNTDAPVSYTFSGMWVDEATRTDNVRDLVAAGAPTVMGGGKLILTGTPVGKDPTFDLLADRNENGRRLEF